MSNHRRLTTEEFEDRLRNVTDALHEEFVVANPYHDPARRTYREYPQLVDALVGSNFDFSFYPSRSGRPADSTGFAQQTVPTPVGAPLPALMPNDAHAVRCASNTVAAGKRCGRAAFHPLTLRSVHFRYWKVHHFCLTAGRMLLVCRILMIYGNHRLPRRFGRLHFLISPAPTGV